MNRGREDRDELAGAVAGSDRGMGPLGPGQRWTAARKLPHNLGIGYCRSRYEGYLGNVRLAFRRTDHCSNQTT